MGLFRRKQETLNEQLLREAGLDPAQILGEPQPPPPAPGPPASVLAAAGVPDGSRVSPREWDATAVVRAPDLAGERVEFTTIPDGDVIVSEEAGDADLSPLADAVERRIDPCDHRESSCGWAHEDLGVRRCGEDERVASVLSDGERSGGSTALFRRG